MNYTSSPSPSVPTGYPNSVGGINENNNNGMMHQQGPTTPSHIIQSPQQEQNNNDNFNPMIKNQQNQIGIQVDIKF
jgi:hypothetical protein